MTWIAHFCAVIMATLCIGGASNAPYDPNATSGVYFMGTQVGVYEDDQQSNQCTNATIERARWPLVIAGIAPGAWPRGQCPSATFNALEWGQYWGRPPVAQAYIPSMSSATPCWYDGIAAWARQRSRPSGTLATISSRIQRLPRLAIGGLMSSAPSYEDRSMVGKSNRPALFIAILTRTPSNF